jgi:glycosyltransferase involved in cell wall biosynthesis
MRQAREIWAQSQATCAALVRSGIPSDRVHAIPGGFRPEIFHPQGPRADLPTTRSFRFLFVGGTIYRKGVDILLQAYGQAFTASDPVSLVIKDFGVDSLYRGQTGEDMIHQFSQNPAYPEVIHLTDLRTPEAMAELYRACDVFVSSYRGEGFCMPALEAMACGLPAMVTGGGSTDDYVSDLCGWRIPSRLISVGNTVYREPVNGEAHLLEADVAALTQLLRDAFANNDTRQAKGKTAAKSAQDWTWDHAAQKVIARCRSLACEMRSASV